MLRAIACLSLALSGAARGQISAALEDKVSAGYVLNIGAPHNGSYPFINLLKSADVYNSPHYAFPNVLNSDGYPQSTPRFDLAAGMYIPPSYTGSYIITWTGQFGINGVPGVEVEAKGSTGTSFTVENGGAFVTNSSRGLYLTGINGTVTFTPYRNTNRLALHFLPTGTLAKITSIAIYRKDHAKRYNDGEVFNPDYLAMLRKLKPGIIRFLGWNNVNHSNRSRQIYDTPTSAMTYTAHQWLTNATTGAWGGTIDDDHHDTGTDTYSGTAPPGWNGLVDGATAQYFITAANTTATPKLSVGGSAPVQIANMGANSPGFYPAVAANFIRRETLNTFVYDAKVNLWLSTTTNGNYGGGLLPSVPVSIQSALCNSLNTDCWFQIPNLYDDASAKEFAAVVMKNLQTPHKAFIEYSNEIGTMGPAFSQFYWASANAAASGFPNGYHDWYALRTRQIFGAITSIWTVGKERLRRVAGAEIFLPIGNVVAYRFGGANLTLDASGRHTKIPAAITTNYTQPPNRPIDYEDAVTIAMYFRGPNVPYTEGQYLTLQSPKEITAITNSAPAVLTVPGNNYVNGDRISVNMAAGGMTELDGAWVTVKNAGLHGPGTFEISNAVNSRAIPISSDTTSYGAYKAGANSARVVPGLNDELLKAADEFASGDSSRMTGALDWFDNDIREGTRKNMTGTTQLGDGTLQHFRLVDFADWTRLVWGPSAFNKPAVLYEGGYDGVTMSSATAAKLGIDPFYSAKISNFLVAYKNDYRFRKVVRDFSELFMTFSNAQAPGWLVDVMAFVTGGAGSINGSTLTATAGSFVVGGILSGDDVKSGTRIVSQLTGVPGGVGTYAVTPAQNVPPNRALLVYYPSPWSLLPGDLYSKPFESFDGLAEFNAAH